MYINDRTEIELSRQRLNKIWSMYSSGELKKTAPNIFHLCDYDGGINGEGHNLWFFNIEQEGGKEAINKAVLILKEILPVHLYENLERAYRSYDTDDEDSVCTDADMYFYEHEQEVDDILREWADKNCI